MILEKLRYVFILKDTGNNSGAHRLDDQRVRVQTLWKQNKGNNKLLGNYRLEYFRNRLFDNTDIGFGQVFFLFFCEQWRKGRRQKCKENSYSYILVQRLGLLVLFCQANTSTMRKNTQKLPFKREMEVSYLWFYYHFRESFLNVSLVKVEEF